MEAGYEVYEYSRRGDLANLRESLQTQKADEYMAYDGSTALVIAARSGFAHIVKELLANGASTTLHTDDGSGMLHHTVSGGSVEAVKLMLDRKVPVDEPNEDGVTPLMLAAHTGELEVVKALCDAGADLNVAADGWGTALDSAKDSARDGAATVVEFLESLGAKAAERGGTDQPLAKGAERFHYGCFESGVNPHDGLQTITASSGGAAPTSAGGRPAVGANVRLAKPKAGILKEDDVGTVIDDDGSDCLPLKVKLGDKHDYYEVHDLVVCSPAVELPPDGDRATAEGTARYLAKQKAFASQLGSTGLSISPVGFGCHRIEKESQHKEALKLAIQIGCNLIDTAPNYTNGAADVVVGEVLKELIGEGKVRRDELVVATKVGNVLGQQMQYAAGVPKMAEINDSLSHCISPEWIEQEISRSLERLGLKCIDCLLLHCPEFEVKSGIEMSEVYDRVQEAFLHLEKEVANGRIAMYGVSAAFYPLRPTDAAHLDLNAVLARLPEEHHFRVLQFPLNYAEPQSLWVAHTPRDAEGRALDKDAALGDTLFEMAKKNGLATWINRPLDGIYKESHGVLRFSSLDCQARSFSELQLDNCDSLEEKLTNLTKLDSSTYGAGEGASGQLAAKTVKLLSGLKDVDCVLLGMRQPQYVIGTLPLALGTPPLAPDVAQKTVKALHNTIEMWFATAIHEADHGTAKDWRLPVAQKFQAAEGA
mmetsp:Transcript_64285/g.114205  ORF Transcript_64285/g.114205 Transcript_64285/m.114205 type:complete len:708 (-) Transcript_64285:40-2163(-)